MGERVRLIEHYQKMAKKGDKIGQYYLGLCYEMGMNIDKDEKLAFHWLGLSARQGYNHAQYRLGLCYLNGIGVQTNPSKGIIWLNKAAR